ncbi:unnamed protein product [Durusdinium trenchii]
MSFSGNDPLSHFWFDRGPPLAMGKSSGGSGCRGGGRGPAVKTVKTCSKPTSSNTSKSTGLKAKTSSPKPTSSQVNRANQLNPCHAAFHQSRGLPPTAAQKAAQTSSKSASSKPSQDTNRANQRNPFHPAFWKSRNIEPGKVEMVYHGTSKDAAQAILKKGFNPSKDGLLGKGVYVTTDRSKAQAFAGDDGRILRAAANLGHVQTVDARAARKYGFSETAWHKTHDSAYVPQGEGVARPEHCVKDPARVIPLGVQQTLAGVGHNL